MERRRVADRLVALASEASGSYDLAHLQRLLLEGLGHLEAVLPPEHVLLRNAQAITFPDPGLMSYNIGRYNQKLEYSRARVVGLLQAAIGVVDDEDLPTDPPSPDILGGMVHAELWSHVAPHVTGQQWPTVALQTVVFVEDYLRRAFSRPASEYGVKLMDVILKPDDGLSTIGETPGEHQGWHQLARGFVGALSNVHRHRIEVRPDSQALAIHVLFTGSLILREVDRHR